MSLFVNHPDQPKSGWKLVRDRREKHFDWMSCTICRPHRSFQDHIFDVTRDHIYIHKFLWIKCRGEEIIYVLVQFVIIIIDTGSDGVQWNG